MNSFRPQRLLFVCALAVLGGCASLPPGSGVPRTVTTALAHPEQTRLGAQFDASAKAHGGNSAYRLIPGGANGFLIRAQMINAAERTLDLQYFIFHGDDTGRLLTYALLRAADRGVRVRLLIDDAETDVGDEQIDALEAHPKIEIRIFNPFHYRGHNEFHRGLEFLLNASRLDYRMHNKLLVVDNAIALIGGRNVGDPYFQMDPDGQFADDDVFSAGPVARELSRTFDEFWNNGLSIPAKALAATKVTRADLKEHRAELKQEGKDLKWYEADPLNRAAFEEAQSVFEAARDLPSDERSQWAKQLLALPRQEPKTVPISTQWLAGLLSPFTLSTRQRRYAFPVAAAFAVALVVGVFEWQSLRVPSVPIQLTATFQTPLATHRIETLPDGSEVRLGARSSISVNFSGETRYLVLEGGEASFKVAKDPSRPFIVHAGQVDVVVGAEYEGSSLFTNQYGTTDASRDAFSIFAEGRIPLIAGPKGAGIGSETLAAQIAVRDDRYSDFGTKTTTQTGLEFRPSSSLLLRSTYGTAFKPPSLYDEASPISTYPTIVVDPLRGGQSTPATVSQGGNPSLAPTTGESATIGFVYSPREVQGLNVSMTWWDLRLVNGISLPSAQYIASNEADYPGRVTRGPSTNGQPGQILSIDGSGL